MITLVESAPGAECVILIVAGTETTGCYTAIELKPSLTFVHWKACQAEPNCREQFNRTIQGRREVQSNRNDNTLAQGTQGQGTGSTLSTEGDANINSATLKTQEKIQADTVALPTVPAILKYGKKKILVNCFLDEGSNTTYVNEDVVEELGVTGEKELITVNVANDQQIVFPPCHSKLA